MSADASSILRGFNGRALQHPPLLHGLALSFFRAWWFCATAVVALGPLVVLIMTGLTHLLALGIAFLWLVVANESSRHLRKIVITLWRQHRIIDGFAITALRPFGREAASLLFRELVAPTLGCYGMVHVLEDATLAHQKRAAADQLDEARILGDTGFATVSNDDEWRAQVDSLIAASDLAVIDMTMPSVNLLWEAAGSLELLPPHRVLFIKVRGRPWGPTMDLVRDYLREKLDADVRGAIEHLAPPLNYGGLLFGTWRFRVSLFLALRRIRRLDRRSAGQWRPWILPEVRDAMESDNTENPQDDAE